MKTVMIVAGFLSTLSMSASVVADTAACKPEITSTGSFFTGHLYKTSQEFPGVLPLDAFKRAYANTVNGGFKISQADKELGMISATQEVVMGDGKTSTYNILVEAAGEGGSKVTVSMTAGSGMVASKGALQKQFCSLFGSISAGQ